MSKSFHCVLENRGLLRVGGLDRGTFLQGLVSNDVNLCKPAPDPSAIFAALLTPQGKFLFDLFITDEGPAFFLDCDAARIDELIKLLAAHKLRAKVTLDNVSGEFVVAAGWNKPRNRQSYADPRHPQMGNRLVCDRGVRHDPNTQEAVNLGDYDRHRLSLGVTDSRDMIVGKSTLLEGNFDRMNGISWSKGCYMGQELTARMHHRALVKKRLFPVKISGATPEFGKAVFDGTAEVGEMRSSNGDLGMALLDVEKAESKKPLTCGTAQLLVLATPPATA